MGGRLLAARFGHLTTLAMVAGWVLMAIGVALRLSESPDVRHDLGYGIYAGGFCLAAVAALLAAIRLRGAAFTFVLASALLFVSLGAVELWAAELAAFGLGLSCKGGCPPDYARRSQDVLAVARAAYASLLAAGAIVVLPLVLAIVRSARTR